MMKTRILAASVLLATLPGLAEPPRSPRPATLPRLAFAADVALAPELAPSDELAGQAEPAEADVQGPAEPAPSSEPAPTPESRARYGAGTEVFYSSDSDDTEVARAAVDLNPYARSANRYLGVRLERAWYNPRGRGWESRDRAYLRGADRLGDWQLRARVGTDGDSVIGAVSLNDEAAIRKEFFVERDIIETAEGLDLGLYSTFAGAAVDLPVDDRNTFTALAGVQTFTGDNERLHLRGSYIHVLRPQWGLSAQLRGRYFRSSEPGEFDYYSPRWYAEVLPVLQMRRFVRGWELVGAGGLGMQRDSGSDWRSSRYVHARFRSPIASNWDVNGAFTYTNTPSVTGTSDAGFSYVQFLLGVSKRF
jgi:hypothetical protein